MATLTSTRHDTLDISFAVRSRPSRAMQDDLLNMSSQALPISADGLAICQKDCDDLEAKMLRSEILFGELVLGYRLRSDDSPFQKVEKIQINHPDEFEKNFFIFKTKLGLLKLTNSLLTSRILDNTAIIYYLNNNSTP